MDKSITSLVTSIRADALSWQTCVLWASQDLAIVDYPKVRARGRDRDQYWVLEAQIICVEVDACIINTELLRTDH